MAMFLKVEGVDGDAKDKDHDKWIDISGWHWGAHLASSMQTGGGTAGGSAQIDQLSIEAKTSSATCTLMGLLLKAEPKKIEIHTTLSYKGAKMSWSEVVLTDATISTISQSHAYTEEGGNHSFDSIVISFEECEQKIWDQKPDGSRGAEKSWKHKVGTGETE